MKRIYLVLGLLLVLFLFTASISPVSAAKKRIRKTASASRGLSYSTARVNRASRSVIVTFQNLGRVTRVDYALSYSANGIPQGVMGSISPTGSATESRDFYFGTCSHGVCTAHNGITNASLLVTTTLSSGATHTKRYLIRSL